VLAEVGGLGDVLLRQLRAGLRGDGHRHALQAFLPLPRGDDRAGPPTIPVAMLRGRTTVMSQSPSTAPAGTGTSSS